MNGSEIVMKAWVRLRLTPLPDSYQRDWDKGNQALEGCMEGALDCVWSREWEAREMMGRRTKKGKTLMEAKDGGGGATSIGTMQLL